MDKVKIGFPIEYECDGIIYDGLFLREPEIEELEKRLKEINKITELEQQCKKQKEVIDKSRQCIKDFLCSEEYINVDGDAIANNYENILDILKGEDKEVSE